MLLKYYGINALEEQFCYLTSVQNTVMRILFISSHLPSDFSTSTQGIYKLTNQALPPIVLDLDDIEHISFMRQIRQPPTRLRTLLYYLQVPGTATQLGVGRSPRCGC